MYWRVLLISSSDNLSLIQCFVVIFRHLTFKAEKHRDALHTNWLFLILSRKAWQGHVLSDWEVWDQFSALPVALM